jgi:hypothetical protein
MSKGLATGTAASRLTKGPVRPFESVPVPIVRSWLQ